MPQMDRSKRERDGLQGDSSFNEKVLFHVHQVRKTWGVDCNFLEFVSICGHCRTSIHCIVFRPKIDDGCGNQTQESSVEY